MLDGKAFGDELVAVVADHIDAIVAPILARLHTLEVLEERRNEAEQARARNESQVDAPMSEETKRDMAAMVAQIKASFPARAPEVAIKGDPGPPPTDEQVKTAVVEWLAANPPQDGKSPDPSDIDRLVSERVVAAIAALPPPIPGQDADPAVTAKIVSDVVAKAVAEIPRPQDGKSVTMDDVSPWLDHAVQKAVGALPKPRDGVGLVGAIIDRDGVLQLSFTDGTIKAVGRVDGAPGKPGENGANGFGFDDMTAELAPDGRTVVLRFVRDEQVKEFNIPFAVVLDRGVYKEGNTYQRGDGCTFGGSFWIAQRETGDKPDMNDAWRLAVKRGRDAASKPFIPPAGPVKS